ncbi:MAG: diaminopimelate decarboxylase [Coriobacteriales bacterium]|jgi:diaminopimelate decarboxylase|nr:diaminopimelate decarboxylase [Coriobacteriales bacterium]
MVHLAHDPDIVADGLTTMDLGAVLPLTAQVLDGHLHLGGVDCVTLAQEYGTALYVMDVAHIKGQLTAYQEALKTNLPLARVVYAGKAFICKAMCRLLAEQDCWLDVSSGGELALALAAGFDPAKIVMHGNNKSPRELQEALDAGVGLIVVDCFEELERLSQLCRHTPACMAPDAQAMAPDAQSSSSSPQPAQIRAASQGQVSGQDQPGGLQARAASQGQASPQPILLRVKPGVVADTHEYIRTGAEDSKFGFGLADGQARQAVEKALADPNLALWGLHVHIGSQIYELDAYRETLEVITNFLAELLTELNFEATVLDMGGGLGIAYQSHDQPATIQELGSLLTGHLRSLCASHGLALPALLVEPGRSIVATAGITLYTVGVVKKIAGVRTYVAVDGGISDNIRTILYNARYEAVLANRANERRTQLVTLAGKHCESGDVVAIDCSLQPPCPGDLVAVFGTGAYCASMSSNYNRQVRPGVVFVENGKAIEVVRRETYADLLACDVG